MRHAIAHMNPEDIVLTEINQPRKEKYYLSRSTREVPGEAKLVMTQGRMVVALATGDIRELFCDSV